MLTPTEYQALIVEQTGDVDPGTLDPPDDPSLGLVAQNIARLWRLHDDKAIRGDSHLQALYVTREALRLVIGKLAPLVNYSEGLGGVRVQKSEEVANRQHQLDDVNKAITEYEGWLAIQGPGVGGRLRTTAPVAPPYPGMRDANAPWLAGSAYYPIRRWRDQ